MIRIRLVKSSRPFARNENRTGLDFNVIYGNLIIVLKQKTGTIK